MVSNLFYLFFFCARLINSEDVKRRTLLISFDGLGVDFLFQIKELLNKTGNQSNIWKLASNSAFADKGIISTYPTLSFPVHYSMLTGLYEESHGVVSTQVYDPVLNKTEFFLDGVADDWVLQNGEPIWETLSKRTDKEILSGCIGWLGCTSSNMSRLMPWNETTRLETMIDQAIGWLQNGSQLVFLYYHEPNTAVHRNFEIIHQAILDIDAGVGYLMEKLIKEHLDGEINVILVSDHGVINVSGAAIPADQVQRAEMDMFHVRMQAATIWNVEPFPGRYNDTINFFSQYDHIRVIEKENIPERWHYKHNSRVSPLIVVADPGYTIVNGCTLLMTHGYDNSLPEMRAIFIGYGPAFIPNSTVPNEMSVVDIYELLCHLLDLSPAPNNGTVSHVESFLNASYLRKDTNNLEQLAKPTENVNRFLKFLSITIGILMLVIIPCSIIDCIRKKKFRSIHKYTTVAKNEDTPLLTKE